jgi:hypothetical protein
VTRLLSLCDWLPPDFGAVGQYALLEARARAVAGDEVTLVGISSTAALVSSESVGKGRLKVIRIQRPLYDRARFGRRLLWTLTTNTRLLWAARKELRRADEVLFTGSPPLLVHWIVPLNRFFKRKLTYRISDFHPECLIAERGKESLALWILKKRTRALRRRVDRFEALGEDQKRRLVAQGIPAERISVRRSGSPVEITPRTPPMRRPDELADRAVLLYSGNFGVAHDDATFVDGYALHHSLGSGRTVLWLNATGAKADRVEARLRELHLPVYRSLPVPLEHLASLLVTPDAHLITLRDAFVGYVLPSKVYGCVASRKPVVYVGPEESDVETICRQGLAAGDFFSVRAGDAASVATALERIAGLAFARRTATLA